MKSQIKNRHGKNIVVQIDNPDEGDELVFIAHGLGGFKEQKHIESFAKAFIKAGYVVVRWDASNTIGESEGSMENATLTNYYEDFEDIVKWAREQDWYKEPFVVSGHSLGSACCILYTTKHQNKVRALAPTSLFLSGKTYSDSLDKAELKGWKEKGFVLQESSSKPGVMKKLNWSLMEDLLTYELFDKAKIINKPTLLMVGSEDSGTPPKDQKRFLEGLATKDKELHIIEGAPHTFKKKNHLKEIEDIMYKWAKRVK